MIEINTTEGTETEYSPEFLQGMVNRMVVSFYKYGHVADAYPDKVDAITSLQKRLDKYTADGNTEWLMDVGNFAMIEFMHPRHKKAHFVATDSEASPGRKFIGKKGFSAEANLQETNTERAAQSLYRKEGD